MQVTKANVSLRDTLLSALQTLPNTVPLDLVVLQSAPKRTTEIFPHAPSAAVRCVDREYLVVVSCGLPALPGDTEGVDTANSGTKESEGEKGANGEDAKDSSGGKVLAAAISAHVYSLPNNAAELVYISKVDSSGYASACGPLTRVLAGSFIGYFLQGPGTVAATLFARAQGQYLFPNSVEGGGKRVLGGLGLCGWWKRVFEDAATKVVEAKEVKPRQVQLSYLLPSYSAAEARGMLPAASTLPVGVQWDYKPPFTHRILPGTSLATLIPSLPDDPKTRFLEELVDDALDKEPYAVRERRRSSQAETSKATSAEGEEAKGAEQGEAKGEKEKERAKLSRKERETEAEEEERRKAYAALEKVPVDEFWERMGFRQECASGDVTGFFHVAVVPDPEGGDASAFVAAAEAAQVAAESQSESKPESKEGAAAKPASKDASKEYTLPQALVERILTSMLNTDFGNRQLASSGTSFWTQATRALVVDAVGEAGWDACFGTVAAKHGVERVQKRKEETVTMLQPRKKKK